MPYKPRKLGRTSSNLDSTTVMWEARIHYSRFYVTNCFAFLFSNKFCIAKQFVRKIENIPMPLTSRSWVQITASFDNFARLARQIKKRNFEVRIVKHVCLKYLSLGALQSSFTIITRWSSMPRIFALNNFYTSLIICSRSLCIIVRSSNLH